MRAAAAVDLGGTKIAGAVVDAEGHLLFRGTEPTPRAGGADAILDAICGRVQVLIRDAARAGLAVEGVGLAAGGSVDQDGVVTHATDMLPGWQGLRLRERLETGLGLPAVIENDGNAFALGELALGAARGHRDVLCISVGTGVGGALIQEGRLRRGPHGMAGEVGHLVSPRQTGLRCECGGTDHIECYTSGRAIEGEYRRRAGLSEDIPLAEIGRRARDDDPAARESIEGAAMLLGRVVGGVVNLLDVELVVIGGGTSSLGAVYLDPLVDAVVHETFVPAVSVVRAVLPPADAALLGAGTEVLRALTAHC